MPHAAAMLIAFTLAITAAPAARAGVAAPEFVAGDIWLVSPALPDGAGTQPGIVCVDPSTWATMTFPITGTILHGRMAYDPARDRLVITSDTGFRTVDPLGVLDPDPLVPPGADNPAAAGDGRVYYSIGGAGDLYFVDPAGAQHTLLDIDGVSQASVASVDALWFDQTTNSIIAADDGVAGLTRVTRLTLNAAGDQVLGSASTTFDVSDAAELAVGFSAGPNGSVFLKVDDNSNNARPRMLLFDPVGVSLSVFATSSYTFVAAEIAGVYSPVAGGAVVLDAGNDQLRVFTQGAVGAGDIVPASGVGGFKAQLVVIAAPCPSDLSGDGVTDGADLGLLLGAWGTPAGDLNGDGTTDGADLGILLGAWGVCQAI